MPYFQIMVNRRLGKRELALFAIPVLFGLICSSPVFRWFQQDELEKKARALAGPNAVDCGRIVIARGNYTNAKQLEINAQSCAAASFTQGKAFFYRWERHNTNHLNYHFMVVGTREKRIFALWGKNDNVDRNGKKRIPDVERLNPEVVVKNGRQIISTNGWRMID